MDEMSDYEGMGMGMDGDDMMGNSLQQHEYSLDDGMGMVDVDQSADTLHGSLQLTIVSARNLANKEDTSAIGDLSDPYIAVPYLRHFPGRTQTQSNNVQDPSWNETFTIELDGVYSSFILQVFDQDDQKFVGDMMGSAVIDVGSFIGGDLIDEWLPLQRDESQVVTGDERKDAVTGAVHVKYQYFQAISEEDKAAQLAQQAEAEAAAAAEKEEKRRLAEEAERKRREAATLAERANRERLEQERLAREREEEEVRESRRRMEEERKQAEALKEQRRLREEREAVELMARTQQANSGGVGGASSQVPPSAALPAPRLPASRISVGDKCWLVLSDDSVVYWNAKRNAWTAVPGRLKSISAAVSSHTIWGVDRKANVWSLHADEKRWGIVQRNSVGHIAVGSSEHIWGRWKQNTVWQYNGHSWDKRGGRLQQLSVGCDGTVFGVMNGAVYSFDSGKKAWRKSGNSSNFRQVSVYDATNIWATKKDNTLHQYEPSSGTWKYYSVPSLVWVEIGSAGIFGITPEGKILTASPAAGQLRVTHLPSSNSFTSVAAPTIVAKDMGPASVVDAGFLLWSLIGNQVRQWKQGKWMGIPGSLISLATAPDNTVLGIDPSYKLWKYSDGKWFCPNPAARLSHIACGGVDSIYGLDRRGALWKMNTDNSFRKLGGCYINVDVGQDGTCLVVTRQGIMAEINLGQPPKRLPAVPMGAAKAAVADAHNIWALARNGQVFRLSEGASGAGWVIEADVPPLRYMSASLNGCWGVTTAMEIVKSPQVKTTSTRLEAPRLSTPSTRGPSHIQLQSDLSKSLHQFGTAPGSRVSLWDTQAGTQQLWTFSADGRVLVASNPQLCLEYRQQTSQICLGVVDSHLDAVQQWIFSIAQSSSRIVLRSNPSITIFGHSERSQPAISGCTSISHIQNIDDVNWVINGTDQPTVDTRPQISSSFRIVLRSARAFCVDNSLRLALISQGNTPQLWALDKSRRLIPSTHSDAVCLSFDPNNYSASIAPVDHSADSLQQWHCDFDSDAASRIYLVSNPSITLHLYGGRPMPGSMIGVSATNHSPAANSAQLFSCVISKPPMESSHSTIQMSGSVFSVDSYNRLILGDPDVAESLWKMRGDGRIVNVAQANRCIEVVGDFSQRAPRPPIPLAVGFIDMRRGREQQWIVERDPKNGQSYLRLQGYNQPHYSIAHNGSGNLFGQQLYCNIYTDHTSSQHSITVTK